jgi:hypothetical protein
MKFLLLVIVPLLLVGCSFVHSEFLLKDININYNNAVLNIKLDNNAVGFFNLSEQECILNCDFSVQCDMAIFDPEADRSKQKTNCIHFENIVTNKLNPDQNVTLYNKQSKKFFCC